MPIYHLIQHNQEEGLLEYREKLTLDISDDKLITAFDKRVKDSQVYWDNEKKLKERRELMKRYWLGKHDTMPLYDYQYPAYIDNRFYMHCEHIVQTVNAQSAEPIVNSKDRSDEAKRMAHQFGEYLYAFAQNHRWNDIDRISTRHLLLYFFGGQEIIWDPMAGPMGKDGKPIGNVVIRHVNPKNLVIDKDAVAVGDPYQDNPAFVAELVSDTLETMFVKYPDKKPDLLLALGIRETAREMSAVINYWKVSFSYFNKEGAPREARVWFSPKFEMVLKKEKSADWDEKGSEQGGETVFRNLLERPLKSYAFLYMNNTGEDFIDETGPLEQLLPMQDHLNKRGQQISDMADEQRGGKVFNTRLVNKNDAARFTNDPGSHLMVKGNAGEAFQRVPPDQLPNYVIEDKFDARTEGDNIVGVHGPSRGERQGNDQPTTIQLLKEGDFQRRSDVINGIERMNEYKYMYAAHLMKLNYTEEHMESVTGDDGKKTFIIMTNEKIPQLAISVKAGTTLPTDKLTQREEALELARMDKIDHITFFERLGFPNPKEQAFKLHQHLTNPDGLYASPDEAEEAEEDIERLKKGDIPEMPDQVSEGYLMGLIEFSKSDEYLNLPPDTKAKVDEYMRQIIDMARQGSVDQTEITPEGQQMQPNQQGVQQGAQQPKGPLSAVRGGLSKVANGVRGMFGG